MTDLSEFAKTILLSPDIEDKLYSPAGEYSDENRNISLPRSFMFPERSKGLEIDHTEKSDEKFPKNFEVESSRGIALHSFANHELLAVELMALCLIKFPDADPSFRKGLYYTMLEEQKHCKLYLKRMRELGVELGDVRVNRFFWDVMGDMKTPLEFITKMSLVFEQANLDYSLYYQKVFEKVEDRATAEIMQTVYEEEIGHVAHGIKWFNEWDDSGKSLYDSHVEKLEFPLSLKWAKGLDFDEDGRRRAGFDKDYIEKIKVFQKSRGSVPDIFMFNPDCEETFGKPEGDKSNHLVESFKDDMSFVTAFLAKSHDVCLVRKDVPSEHLAYWANKGLKLPEIIKSKSPIKEALKIAKGRKIGTLQSWGAVSDLDERLSNPQSFEKDNLFSKVENLEVIESIHAVLDFPLLEENISSYAVSNENQFKSKAASLLAKHENILLKSEFGSSGRGNLKVNKEDLSRDNVKQFILNTFSEGEKIIVEPWRKRICDFSFVGNVNLDKEAAAPTLLRPICDHLGQYRGHFIGGYPLGGLSGDVKKHLYDQDVRFDELLLEIKEMVVSYLESSGYIGNYGVDLYLYKNAKDELKLAISEINVRTTMGHVAKRLNKIIGIKPPHLWMNLAKPILTDEALNEIRSYSKDSDVFPLVPCLDDSKFVSFLIKSKSIEQGFEKLETMLKPKKSNFVSEVLAMMKF